MKRASDVPPVVDSTGLRPVSAPPLQPLTLLWPAYGLAFALSLVGVWLNDLAFSWGQMGMQKVVIQSVEEIVYGMLRTQRSYANQRFSIVVKDVQACYVTLGELIGFDLTPWPRVQRWIAAMKARPSWDAANGGFHA